MKAIAWSYDKRNLEHQCRECDKTAIVHFTNHGTGERGFYCEDHAPRIEDLCAFPNRRKGADQ